MDTITAGLRPLTPIVFLAHLERRVTGSQIAGALQEQMRSEHTFMWRYAAITHESTHLLVGSSEGIAVWGSSPYDNPHAYKNCLRLEGSYDTLVLTAYCWSPGELGFASPSTRELRQDAAKVQHLARGLRMLCTSRRLPEFVDPEDEARR